jgi:predicted nucleic acid-binding protein
MAMMAGDTLFIVATMATHGIRTLVTQNHDDFARFDEIDTVSLIDLVRA